MALKDSISYKRHPFLMFDIGLNFFIDKNGPESFAIGFYYALSFQKVMDGEFNFYENSTDPRIPIKQNNLKPDFRSVFSSTGSSINFRIAYRLF